MIVAHYDGDFQFISPNRGRWARQVAVGGNANATASTNEPSRRGMPRARRQHPGHVRIPWEALERTKAALAQKRRRVPFWETGPTCPTR